VRVVGLLLLGVGGRLGLTWVSRLRVASLWLPRVSGLGLRRIPLLGLLGVALLGLGRVLAASLLGVGLEGLLCGGLLDGHVNGGAPAARHNGALVSPLGQQTEGAAAARHDTQHDQAHHDCHGHQGDRHGVFSKLLDIIIVNIVESSVPGVADEVPRGAAPHLHALPTAEGVVRRVSKAGAVEFLLQYAKHFSFTFHRRTLM